MKIDRYTLTTTKHESKAGMWCKHSDHEKEIAEQEEFHQQSFKDWQISNVSYEAEITEKGTKISELLSLIDKNTKALDEKDARIARLEAEGNKWRKKFMETVASNNTVKADAIDEMVNKTNCQDPAMRVVQDIIDYTNKLRSNK